MEGVSNNKVSSKENNCCDYFVNVNPEIGVVAFAVIAALGVVLHSHGIGSFTLNCALSSTALSLFVIFTALTLSKHCLTVTKAQVQTAAEDAGEAPRSATPLTPPPSGTPAGSAPAEPAKPDAASDSKPAAVAPPQAEPAKAEEAAQARPATPKANEKTEKESDAPKLNGGAGPMSPPAGQGTGPSGASPVASKLTAQVTVDLSKDVQITLPRWFQFISTAEPLAFSTVLQKALLEVQIVDGKEIANPEVVWKMTDSLRNTVLHVAANAAVKPKEKVGSILQTLAPKTNSNNAIRNHLLNAGDYKGRKAIHLAYEPKVLETLIDADQSQLEICDNQQNTPLLYMAERGSWKCIDFLMKEGANKDARNKEGATFKDIATARYNQVKQDITETFGVNNFPDNYELPEQLKAELTDEEEQSLKREAELVFEIAKNLGIK